MADSEAPKPGIIHTHEPNLIEEIFDYANVPKIVFDGKIREEINGELVSFDPNDMRDRDIFITDTTFRDAPAVVGDQFADRTIRRLPYGPVNSWTGRVRPGRSRS